MTTIIEHVTSSGFGNSRKPKKRDWFESLNVIRDKHRCSGSQCSWFSLDLLGQTFKVSKLLCPRLPASEPSLGPISLRVETKQVSSQWTMDRETYALVTKTPGSTSVCFIVLYLAVDSPATEADYSVRIPWDGPVPSTFPTYRIILSSVHWDYALH